MEKPYTDIETTDSYILREFNDDIDPIELMWHRDDGDRMVEIIEPGENWGFQFENELPWELEKNLTIFIMRHEWHRVIKGTGTLKLKIYNCD